MATLTGVSPVLHVADVARAADWYRDRLGFACEVFGDPPDFATATRDEAGRRRQCLHGWSGPARAGHRWGRTTP